MDGFTAKMTFELGFKRWRGVSQEEKRIQYEMAWLERTEYVWENKNDLEELRGRLRQEEVTLDCVLVDPYAHPDSYVET